MQNKNLRKLIMAALMAALVFVATMVIKIPTPTNGYLNLGDCFVLLSGWLLGPWYGFAAGGIGSMLVDLLGGYFQYVPGTFLIKGLMALVAAFLYKALHKTVPAAALPISGLVGECIMVGGYYLYESTVCGYGFMGAAAGIPGNCVQGVAGLVIGIALMAIIRSTKLDQKLI